MVYQYFNNAASAMYEEKMCIVNNEFEVIIHTKQNSAEIFALGLIYPCFIFVMLAIVILTRIKNRKKILIVFIIVITMYWVLHLM